MTSSRLTTSFAVLSRPAGCCPAALSCRCTGIADRSEISDFTDVTKKSEASCNEEIPATLSAGGAEGLTLTDSFAEGGGLKNALVVFSRLEAPHHRLVLILDSSSTTVSRFSLLRMSAISFFKQEVAPTLKSKVIMWGTPTPLSSVWIVERFLPCT